MAKSVISHDRGHVVVADMDDIEALRKRIEALEEKVAGKDEPASPEPKAPEQD